MVGVPTDTVYGIAADPHSAEAIASLFQIKDRDARKHIGLLVADTAQALEMIELPQYALDWTTKHWPGPLNLVGRPKVEVLVGSIDALAIRVPDHPIALALLRSFGPLAVTSANLSGEPETFSDWEARALLGQKAAVYLPGVCPGGMASTTVDIRSEQPVLLRTGPLELDLGRANPLA